jgi:hypothetical protein
MDDPKAPLRPLQTPSNPKGDLILITYSQNGLQTCADTIIWSIFKITTETPLKPPKDPLNPLLPKSCHHFNNLWPTQASNMCIYLYLVNIQNHALKPPWNLLNPHWDIPLTPFKHFKFKYNRIYMIFGQIKLRICALTTSDQDVKISPKAPLTPPEAPWREHLKKNFSKVSRGMSFVS